MAHMHDTQEIDLYCLRKFSDINFIGLTDRSVDPRTIHQAIDSAEFIPAPRGKRFHFLIVSDIQPVKKPFTGRNFIQQGTGRF